MGLVKLTFDGSTIQAKDDAELNYFLFGHLSGSIDGTGSLSPRIENNYIIFRKSCLVIMGRVVYVEEGTKIYVSMDSNKKGVVFIDIDLSDNSVTLSKAEQADEMPTLIREDIVHGGTRHQFPIFYYEKTTSSIKQVAPYYPVNTISNYNERFSGMWDDVVNYLDENYRSLVSPYLGTYKAYYQIDEFEYERDCYEWLYCVRLNNNYIVTFPGRILGTGSTASVKYDVGGVAYTMIVEYSAGYLIFTMSNKEHLIKNVYVYR